MDRIIDRTLDKPKPKTTDAGGEGDAEPNDDESKNTTDKSGQNKNTTDKSGLRSSLADFDEADSFMALRNFEGVNYKRDQPKKNMYVCMHVCNAMGWIVSRFNYL